MPSTDVLAQGYTAAQIASLVNVSERSVQRRSGIDDYLIGTLPGGGRPAKVYDPQVLTIFGKEAPAAMIQPERVHKVRSDRGCPRTCGIEEWDAVLNRTQGLYMANAQPNLRMACEHALQQLKQEGVPVTQTPAQVYSKLTRRSKDNSRETSPFYLENWELLHETTWRKKNTALALPTLYYDWQSIFESENLAGPGYGAMRFWSMDGHKGDVWTTDATGKSKFAYFIYIRDGLTGFPLHVEEVDSESSMSVIRALVRCMLKHRRVPDLGIAMDNAVSSMTHQALGVISSMLDPIAWEYAQRYPEIYGTSGSPIIRNLPNIPKAPLKAAIERSFKQMKDEHDAPRFPRVYQGGNRSEAVQLGVNNRPALHLAPSTDEYFQSLERWITSDYITRERPDQFPLLVERGLPPTIDEAFAIYGGYDLPAEWPAPERIAKILYWATEAKAIVTAQLGQAAATIGGEWWPVASAALDNRTYGHKVAIVPFPGDSQRALLLLADDPTDPQYIGMSMRTYVRTMQAVAALKPVVMQTQTELRTRLRDARSGIQAAAWRNIGTPADIAEAPQLGPAPTQQIGDTSNDAPVEISSDTAQLLSDIENDLF